MISPVPKPGVIIRAGDIVTLRNWDDSVCRRLILLVNPERDLVVEQDLENGEMMRGSLAVMTYEVIKIMEAN